MSTGQAVLSAQHETCDSCGPYVSAAYVATLTPGIMINKQSRTIDLPDRLTLTLCGHHARRYWTELHGWTIEPLGGLIHG